MTLYYMPLEGYRERYTMQWSAPKTGWLERRWIEAGINYRRVEGSVMARNEVQSPPNTIKLGSVVDGVGRSAFCFNQITELLSLAQAGHVKSSDVIFIDDFWTPGLEALPYAFHLMGIKPRMYAFLHAQSVDEFDFTHPMRKWMRPIEKGFGTFLQGIFVCCPTLRDLVCHGGIADWTKVHVTGHPFASDEVMERMPQDYREFMACQRSGPTLTYGRNNDVVWSSRWDAEKNPRFFLELAKTMIEGGRVPNVRFLICTSAPQLRSNNLEALERARVMALNYPNQFQIRENLTKEEYYSILTHAKVQFNCASQDFVAITLLESAVAGCYPVYPYFRSFPETFLGNTELMYQHLDVNAAIDKLARVLHREDLWTRAAIEGRQWIYKRFDSSWKRMTGIMGLTDAETSDPYPGQW